MFGNKRIEQLEKRVSELEKMVSELEHEGRKQKIRTEERFKIYVDKFPPVYFGCGIQWPSVELSDAVSLLAEHLGVEFSEQKQSVKLVKKQKTNKTKTAGG